MTGTPVSYGPDSRFPYLRIHGTRRPEYSFMLVMATAIVLADHIPVFFPFESHGRKSNLLLTGIHLIDIFAKTGHGIVQRFSMLLSGANIGMLPPQPLSMPGSSAFDTSLSIQLPCSA